MGLGRSSLSRGVTEAKHAPKPLVAVFLAALCFAIMSSGTDGRPEGSVLYGHLFGVSPLALLLFVVFGLAITLGLASALWNGLHYKLYLASALLAGGLFQILPALEGYYLFGKGDPSHHLGWIITLLNTGRTSSLNPYPSLHILSAMLVEVSGVPLFSLPVFVGEVVFILFLLGSFLLIPALFKSDSARRLSYLMLPSVSLGSYYVPQNYALALLPMILFLYTKRGRGAGMTYVSLLTALTITHPLVTLVLILTTGLWETFGKRQNLSTRTLLGAILLMCWMSYNLYISVGLSRLVSEFGLGSPPAESAVTEALSRLGPFEAAAIFGRQVGLTPILALVEIWLIARRRETGGHTGLLFFFLLLSFLLFPPSILVTSFGLTYRRFLPYLGLGSTLAAGVLTNNSISTSPRRTLTSLLLIGVFLTSILGTYPSWYNYYPSNQVTYDEYISSSWIFEHLPPAFAIGGPLYDPKNAWDLVEGTPATDAYWYRYYPFRELSVGYHFLLERNSSLRGFLLVTTLAARLDYATLYKNTDTFNVTDFHNILSRPNLNLVYSSPDVQVLHGAWIVRSANATQT